MVNTPLYTYNLFGLCILNTRPPGYHNSKLNEQMIKAGGRVINCPTLAVQPVTDNWLGSLPELTTVDHAIFISANAVSYFFQQLNLNHRPWPGSIQVTAIGKACAETLSQQGIRVDNRPAIADSEHLLSLQCWQTISQQQVLLVKGQGGRTLIADTLKALGAQLIDVAVYQRIMPEANRIVMQKWHNLAVDIILITSQQGLEQLFMMFPPADHQRLKALAYVVISPRLGEIAAKMGINTRIIARPETIMASLHQFNQRIHP